VTPTTPRAARVLSAARPLLRARWLQGEGVARNGGAVVGGCVIGAIVTADPGGTRPDRTVLDTAVAALHDALWLRPGDPPGAQGLSPAERARFVRRVAAWNDRPGRTVPEVIELVDRAILRLSDDLSVLEVLAEPKLPS